MIRRLLDFGLAAMAVYIALLITLQLSPYWRANTMALFYAAVLLGARRGGIESGALAAALSLLSSAFFLFPPVYSFHMESREDQLRVLFFIPLSILLVVVAEQLRRTVRRSNKQAEVLEESQNLISEIVESCNDAILSKTPDGTITSWNKAAERTFGYTADEVLGKSPLLLTPPELVEEEEEILRRLQQGDHITHYETERLRKDGGRIQVSMTLSPIRDAGGNIFGASTIARDVTESKRSEERLRESEERARARAEELATLMESVPALIFIAHDTEGKIITGNRAAHRILRMESGENLSKSAPEGESPTHFKVFKDGQEVPPENLPVQLAARGVEVRDFEEEVRFANGDSVYLFGNAMPLHDEQGRVRGAVSTFVDITARKQAEEALKEADRRKDEFLAMLAHELRNPLAPISNASRVLRHITPSIPLINKMHDMIERQTQQLTRLVDDLLDVSRITRRKITLQRERLELMSVISRAVETSRPLIDAARHQLTISLPTEPIRIEGDLTRLAQVLANILGNAAKYTEEGGEIEISAAAVENEAIIRVKDNGIGIPANALPHIFDLFTQADRSLDRSQGGLGIGLTIVKNIVEMHGGSVIACSDGPGKGSEFVIRLPLYIGLAPETEGQTVEWAQTIQEAAAAPGRRVMVVDDHADSAESLALYLKIEGCEVVVAHDGPETLEIAREFRPQVVLLDIGLPGMNGYEVARALRRLPGLDRTILIALTGYGQEEDRLRSKEAGFDLHLTKPVDHHALLTLIRSYTFD